jgi:small-conductance mechanosensitive channel
MERMTMTMQRLPPWLQEWVNIVAPAAEVLVIVATAWLLRRFIGRLVDRIGERYHLPAEMRIGARRMLGFLIYGAAFLLALERIGVSATVLWTAFTGFATVAAVAFFAVWSVLSNIFCTLMIFTTRLFRLDDHVELVVDDTSKPGIKGRVLDINLVYTTLQEEDQGPTGAILQVPNSLFFQRSVRRWRDPASPSR